MKKLLKSVAALSLSAMMLLSPGVLAEEDEEESNVVELTTVVQEYEGKQIVLKTAGLDILEQDGYKFKDLNKNGELDQYEDWRLTPEERTEDLLSRMSDKNKAAQMAHMTLVTLKESWFSDLDIGFALTYTYFAESKESAGEKMNYVQSLCEESELGIPVVFSMDSVIGASWINDTTILPDAITLGATGDAELVHPADIAPEIKAELNRLTALAYKACRCRGVVRVDFIVTPEGKPYLIEINSIPGMSGGSIVPKQVREAGMTLGELYDLIIEDTYDRDRR